MSRSEAHLVVVGGAGAIGLAVARRYARDGGSITLIDRDPNRLEAALACLRAMRGSSDGIRGYPHDITQTELADALVERIVQDVGPMDVLVHAAGLTQVSPCRATTIDVYRRVFEVNFFGVVALTRAAISALAARRGSIVILSSVAGFAPLIGRTGYCASKYALHGFFETLRCELARDGVGVVIVCPSFVASDFATRGLAGDGSTLAFERSTTGTPLKPDVLADRIHRAVQRGHRLVLPSFSARLAYWFSRLVPRLYDRLMARRFRIELDRPHQPPT